MTKFNELYKSVLNEGKHDDWVEEVGDWVGGAEYNMDEDDFQDVIEVFEDYGVDWESDYNFKQDVNRMSSSKFKKFKQEIEQMMYD